MIRGYATNTSLNTTKSTNLVNHTPTDTPVYKNITNTSVKTTKGKEIQNLTAKIKINQADIQGLTKVDNNLEKQIPALMKQEKYVRVKDFIATMKKDQVKITDPEKHF